MKEFECNDVIPGCDFKTSGRDEEEIIKKGVEHGREKHGIQQMDEATLAKVRAAIRDVEEKKSVA